MFGKGIYLADMVTKSANYCYTLTGDAFLLLCDVALGTIQEEIDAKDLKKPKKGKNSVKGKGKKKKLKLLKFRCWWNSSQSKRKYSIR